MNGLSKLLIFIAFLGLFGCSSGSDVSMGTDTVGGGIQCKQDQDCQGFSSGPCIVGQCDQQTHKCVRHYKPNGTKCDDHNLCTLDEVCTDGQCTGKKVKCGDPSDSCLRVDCVPDKGCVVTNQLDGTTCDDKNPCTEDDVCVNGACRGKHKACDDHLDCTVDSCDNGKCMHLLQQGWCLIDGHCYSKDGANPDNRCQVCDPSFSKSEWKVLPDGTDLGNGFVCYQKKECDHNENCRTRDCGDDGCGGSCGKCGTHYQCKDGKCAYQASCGNGECESSHGENCDNCPKDCGCADGQVCFNASCCTPDCKDKDCGADGCGGSCWKGDGTECNDLLECTQDQCVMGKCEHEVKPGKCLIDGSCFDDGDKNKDNDCQLCKADLQNTKWTNQPDDSFCNNNNGKCISGSCCVANCKDKQCGDDGCGGSCWTGDSNHVCDDNLECTLDSCSEKGICNNNVKSGYCVIDDQCYQNGAKNPDNPCEVCNSEKAQYAWTVYDDGFDLQDGNVCFKGKPCAKHYHCEGRECGDDECGGECGTCANSYICQANGKCKYQASCGNGICDTNHGENCATCAADCKCDDKAVCFNNACCTPQCDNRECGDDQCGGECGSCDYGEFCDPDSGRCLGKLVWQYNILPTVSEPAVNGEDVYVASLCADGNFFICGDDQEAKIYRFRMKDGQDPEVTTAKSINAIMAPISVWKHDQIMVGDNQCYIHEYEKDLTPVAIWNACDQDLALPLALSKDWAMTVTESGTFMLLNMDGHKVADQLDYDTVLPTGVSLGLAGSYLVSSTLDQIYWATLNANGITSKSTTSLSGQIGRASIVSTGFLADDIYFPVIDGDTAKLCHGVFNKKPDCYFIGKYSKLSDLVLEVVESGQKQTIHGFLTAIQEQNNSHKALLLDMKYRGSPLPIETYEIASLPNTFWASTPVMLANKTVVFVADNCLYAYHDPGNGMEFYWKSCLSYPFYFITSPVPGKFNGEDVVYVISSDKFRAVYRIMAFRTLQPIRKVDWPCKLHDTMNTACHTDNTGAIPW